MICAEDEIGLGNSHAGIMVLDENTEVGMQASFLFGIENDYIIEIGLTPNRTDAFSHIGVARDLAAALSFRRQAEPHDPEPAFLVFSCTITASFPTHQNCGCRGNEPRRRLRAVCCVDARNPMRPVRLRTG